MVDLARELGTDEYLQKIDELVRALDRAEGKPDRASTEMHAGKSNRTHILHTGRRPLSMYDKELWQKAYPYLFPYGDGVFGIARVRPMTFQQCAYMLLLRTELDYQIAPEASIGPPASCGRSGRHSEHDLRNSGCPLVAKGLASCAQCRRATDAFVPTSMPRWRADLNFQCALYDTWRRMDLVRRAGAHVRRRNFRSSIKLICSTTAQDIASAFAALGEKAGVREVLRSNGAPAALKEALTKILFFSSDVVGSDGARQQLRHEQTGDMLRYGGIGGFLTPNVADTRHLLLHAEALNHTAGGFADDGRIEKYSVDLLDECPNMPAAEEMLRIIARDPVAQARFFIICMQLFCEHILGTGPFDTCLRHNGLANGVVYPDGYAAFLLGGAMTMIASMHGPIEEQARLSCHSHMVFHYIHRQSQAWLRSVLRKEAPDARDALRKWQEAVIAAVGALQITACATVPLHFVDDPQQAPDLKSTPYLEAWREEDRFDGALEGDKKDPAKRLADVPAVPAFRDHYIANHLASLSVEKQGVRFSERSLSLKGSVMSKLPHYSIMAERTLSCHCEACVARHRALSEPLDSDEAAAYAEAFSRDHWEIWALSGHIHRHHETCFKYVDDGVLRKPQHCWFGFVNFGGCGWPRHVTQQGKKC